LRVRQAGELLAQMKMRGERSGGGKSGANKQHLKHHRGSREETLDKLPKLSDLGVTKQQSSRYSNSSSNAASRTRT
jgi:hypothetical protein